MPDFDAPLTGRPIPPLELYKTDAAALHDLYP
jgi:hypothetical protein